MTVSITDPDNAGWTEVTLQEPAGRAVYVSDSGGNDGNDGFSEDQAVATLSAGYALLRDARPDWLLLKRGDTWVENFPTWEKDGADSSGRHLFDLRTRMLVASYGSYGDARPKLQFTSGSVVDFSISTPTGANYLAFLDIHFEYTGAPGAAVGFDIHNGSYVHIENCRFEKCSVTARVGSSGDLDTGIDHLTIFRCAVDNHLESGLFISETEDLLVKECYLFNNGVFENDQDHNIYLSGNFWGPVNGTEDPSRPGLRNKVVDSIIQKAQGNFGIKVRNQSHGEFSRNFFTQNRAGIDFESHYPNDRPTGSVIKDNVFSYSGSPDQAKTARGIDISGQSDAVVSGNIFNRAPDGTAEGNSLIEINVPVEYDNVRELGAGGASEDGGDYSGVWNYLATFPAQKNILITSNIFYRWNGPVLRFAQVNPSSDVTFQGKYKNIQFVGNDVQGGALDAGFAVTSPLIEFLEDVPLEKDGGNGVLLGGNAYWSVADVDTAWFRWDGDPLEVGGSQLDIGFNEWTTRMADTSAARQITYDDPDRGIVEYYASIGITIADPDAAFTTLIAQERGNYDARLTAANICAYVREGFGR